MMRSTVLGLMLGGLLACGSLPVHGEQQMAEQEQGSQAESAFTVELRKEYGFCLEDCTLTVRVSSEGEGLARVLNRSSGTEREKDFTVPPAELAALGADLEKATAQPWEERYGCPDCADQGAYHVHLMQGGQERQTVVDPMQLPPHLAPLLKRLNTLEVAHRP